MIYVLLLLLQTAQVDAAINEEPKQANKENTLAVSPKNNAEALFEYQKFLADQSEKQIKNVKDYFNFLLTGLTILVGILSGLFGYMYHTSLKGVRRSYEQKAQNVVDNFERKVEDEYKSKTKKIIGSLIALRQSLSAYYDVKLFKNVLIIQDKKGKSALFSRQEQIITTKKISEFSDYLNFPGPMRNLTNESKDKCSMKLKSLNDDQNLLITTMHETIPARREFTKKFSIDVEDSFMAKSEFLSVSVLRPTQKFELKVQFPKKREYKKHWLMEAELGSTEERKINYKKEKLIKCKTMPDKSSVTIEIEHILKPMKYTFHWDW